MTVVDELMPANRALLGERAPPAPSPERDRRHADLTPKHREQITRPALHPPDVIGDRIFGARFHEGARGGVVLVDVGAPLVVAERDERERRSAPRELRLAQRVETAERGLPIEVPREAGEQCGELIKLERDGVILFLEREIECAEPLVHRPELECHLGVQREARGFAQ